MTLLEAVAETIERSGHKFCTVTYIHEHMVSPFDNSGELNVAIGLAIEYMPIAAAPVACQTGYISTVMVREEYKWQVAKELFQDHEDLALGRNELQNSKTGFAYAYQVWRGR